MNDWDRLLDFWFAPAAKAKWFDSDAEFDALLRERFQPLHMAAALGELAPWELHPDGALAVVILLDQIPRNIFRGTARAFATDGAALAAAERAIAKDFDRAQSFERRKFLYLPFEHSENLADQLRGVDHFSQRTQDLEGVEFAERHLQVIRRFGRFPHRNQALNRVSTKAERDYLEERRKAGLPPY
jgi:uncharacterized protein (DUF924 family)